VRVSWPVQLTNFALQFNTQANTPSWSDVDAPVIVLGDKNTVIQRAPPEESYYRLRN
jgi:hypothetical protein